MHALRKHGLASLLRLSKLKTHDGKIILKSTEGTNAAAGSDGGAGGGEEVVIPCKIANEDENDMSAIREVLQAVDETTGAASGVKISDRAAAKEFLFEPEIGSYLMIKDGQKCYFEPVLDRQKIRQRPESQVYAASKSRQSVSSDAKRAFSSTSVKRDARHSSHRSDNTTSARVDDPPLEGVNRARTTAGGYQQVAEAGGDVSGYQVSHYTITDPPSEFLETVTYEYKLTEPPLHIDTCKTIPGSYKRRPNNQTADQLDSTTTSIRRDSTDQLVSEKNKNNNLRFGDSQSATCTVSSDFLVKPQLRDTSKTYSDTTLKYGAEGDAAAASTAAEGDATAEIALEEKPSVLDLRELQQQHKLNAGGAAETPSVTDSCSTLYGVKDLSEKDAKPPVHVRFDVQLDEEMVRSSRAAVFFNLGRNLAIM